MAWPIQLAELVVLLGGLIFFHELGHFLVAKACNVKVLKFSLGFGRKLIGFKRGETEYQIAWLPLGGYVKMLGEDPTQKVEPADRGRGFSEQAPWKRGLIAFAGPGFNLILPPIVFFAMNMVPMPQDTPVVGTVLQDEPAQRAGIQPRDRVVSVGGVPTQSFDEMRDAIEERGGQPTNIVVNRRGETISLQVTPVLETLKTPVEILHKGRIGITPPLPSYVGIVPGSRASQAGLRTFDHVIAVNGEKITSVSDLDDSIKKAGNAPLHFDVIRQGSVDLKTASIATEKALAFDVVPGSTPLGVERADLYISEVIPGGQAESGGLKPLDKVVGAQGQPIYSAMRLGNLIEDQKKISLKVDRSGQLLDVSFASVETIRKDKLLGKVPDTDYGFRFHRGTKIALAPTESVIVHYTVPQAASRAIKETYNITRTMLLGLWALVSGQIPLSNIGGPIQMYDMVGMYGQNGFASLLTIFVLISVNLGLINLLPVPVLDGFHIVIAVVEGVSRRVVPIRAREIAQTVGLAMLVALMVLAFYNDISRKLGM